MRCSSDPLLVVVDLVWVFYWLVFRRLEKLLRLLLILMLKLLLVTILSSQRGCSCTKRFILARLRQFMVWAVVISVGYFCCVLLCWWWAKWNRRYVIHYLRWNNGWLYEVSMKDNIWLRFFIILIESHLCNTFCSLCQRTIAPSRRTKICLIAWHTSLACL